MKNIYDKVEANMDNLVDKQVWWSNCATEEQIAAAKGGKLELTLGIKKPVPKEWITDISGKPSCALPVPEDFKRRYSHAQEPK